MTKPTDDLEAVRLVVEALEPFDSKDRERIIRWSCEKLGMPSGACSTPPVTRTTGATDAVRTEKPTAQAVPTAPAVPTDIRTFIQSKNPRSDNHLAAVVAYFHHFAAPAEQQRDFITKEDLIDACRKADRKRPGRPVQVLVNSYHAGILDKADRGQYRLNSVGENLVAMVLPESDDAPRRPRGPGKTTRKARQPRATKNTPRKKRSPSATAQK